MRASVNAEKMIMKNYKPVEVTTDLISELHFPKEDVLTLAFDKNQRIKDLQHANILGNAYKTKVSIVFEDIEGVKQVNAEVKELNDKDMVIEKELIIPIHRVVRIFY